RRREDPNERQPNENQQAPDRPNQRPVLERVAKPPAWTNQRTHHWHGFFFCQFRSAFHNQLSAPMQPESALRSIPEIAQIFQIQGTQGEILATGLINQILFLSE